MWKEGGPLVPRAGRVLSSAVTRVTTAYLDVRVGPLRCQARRRSRLREYSWSSSSSSSSSSQPFEAWGPIMVVSMKTYYYCPEGHSMNHRKDDICHVDKDLRSRCYYRCCNFTGAAIEAEK